MKTILISIPFGMSARNFLRSKVLSTIKSQARVVVLSPLAENEEFVKEFAGPQVTVLSVPLNRTIWRKIISRLLYPLQAYWFTKKTQLTTLLFLAEELRKKRPLRYARLVLMGETLGRLGFFRSWLSDLYYRSMQNPLLLEMLNQQHVDLIFTTHGYVPMDVELAVCAQTRNIPVVNMIHSWDNLTSKSGLCQLTNDLVGSLLPVQFHTRAIVWNEILRAELKDLYGYPEEKIFVSGIPQFDLYPSFRETSSREKFFQSLGMDPRKKLLLFVVTHPSIISDQVTIVKDLVGALRSQKFDQPCQLLIRTHPGDPTFKELDQFQGPDVFFQRPTSSFTPREIKSWERENDNPLALAEALCHCDVMINGISTTAIEAAAFDKPCINLGFDGDPVHNLQIPQFYKNSHYEKLTRTQGFRIAWNKDQLVDQINDYLAHPELDREGRELIRQQQCFQLDGKSAERIGQFLLDVLNTTFSTTV